VPRDRYNTELRVKIGQELMAELDGQSLEFTPMLTDSPLARIHYLVRAREQAPHMPDWRGLEARIAKLAERWDDDCTLANSAAHVGRRPGPGPGPPLCQRLPHGLP
jgi:glutamate dehydrogenase